MLNGIYTPEDYCVAKQNDNPYCTPSKSGYTEYRQLFRI